MTLEMLVLFLAGALVGTWITLALNRPRNWRDF
jgi:hypothetical protein